jgi:hypothetical protein
MTMYRFTGEKSLIGVMVLLVACTAVDRAVAQEERPSEEEIGKVQGKRHGPEAYPHAVFRDQPSAQDTPHNKRNDPDGAVSKSDLLR